MRSKVKSPSGSNDLTALGPFQKLPEPQDFPVLVTDGASGLPGNGITYHGEQTVQEQGNHCGYKPKSKYGYNQRQNSYRRECLNE